MAKAATPVLRYLPHPLAAILHLLLLAAVFALFMGRKPGVFRSEALIALLPGVYSHMSNFALSYLLYAGIGYLWLMMGVRLRGLAWAGWALVAANLVYEFLIPVLNTRDPVDALYGVTGTAFAFLVLWLLMRFGLVPNPEAAVPQSR